MFQRQLASVFRRHSNLDQVTHSTADGEWHYCISFLSLQAVEEFCDGLIEYIGDPVRWVVRSSPA